MGQEQKYKREELLFASAQRDYGKSKRVAYSPEKELRCINYGKWTKLPKQDPGQKQSKLALTEK